METIFFNVESLVRDLSICFFSKYVLNRKCIPDTLMGRVVKLGFSPTRAALHPTLNPLYTRNRWTALWTL